MYNRYIPEDTFYTPVIEEPPPRPEPPKAPAEEPPAPPRQGQRPSAASQSGMPFGFPKGLESLSALVRGVPERLKRFRLEDVDSGDILLLLILLYLLAEGDDMDLVIALGLVLLMGLGEGKG